MAMPSTGLLTDFILRLFFTLSHGKYFLYPSSLSTIPVLPPLSYFTGTNPIVPSDAPGDVSF
jgi:hypothetical protein